MSIEDNGYYVHMSIYKKYTFMYVYGVGGALKRWTLIPSNEEISNYIYE